MEAGMDNREGPLATLRLGALLRELVPDMGGVVLLGVVLVLVARGRRGTLLLLLVCPLCPLCLLTPAPPVLMLGVPMCCSARRSRCSNALSICKSRRRWR